MPVNFALKGKLLYVLKKFIAIYIKENYKNLRKIYDWNKSKFVYYLGAVYMKVAMGQVNFCLVFVCKFSLLGWDSKTR